jgi:hypothetical protein
VALSCWLLGGGVHGCLHGFAGLLGRVLVVWLALLLVVCRRVLTSILSFIYKFFQVRLRGSASGSCPDSVCTRRRLVFCWLGSSGGSTRR